jgi:hypothetical protein
MSSGGLPTGAQYASSNTNLVMCEGLMDAEKSAKLAQGLAAAAIVALVHDPVAAAVMRAGLPTLFDWAERQAASRDLQLRVRNAVTAWAAAEQFSDDSAEGGLRLATETVLKFGLTHRDLKQLDYDPVRATDAIVQRARSAKNRDWAAPDTFPPGLGKLQAGMTSAPKNLQDPPQLIGRTVDGKLKNAEPIFAGYGNNEDAEHQIARRAIEVTMESLVGQSHSIEATLLAAIRQEARATSRLLQQLTAGNESIDRRTEHLVTSLTGAASRADLIVYLRQRIADWDTSPWDRHQSSQIERTLRATEGRDKTRDVIVADALDEYEHLVILGDPGAGKSWLARRIARTAAMEALSSLEDGAEVGDTEIPVFTTWGAWETQEGDTRRTLIRGSFKAGLGHSDLGGPSVTDRVIRLLEASPRILAIVDALDESRNQQSITGRLYELQGIGSWRTVVTSRPAAWDAKTARREQTKGVVELQPLDWELDAVPFINTWFAEDFGRANALVAQIRNRPHLQPTAEIPLLLTFYCLYAEHEPPDSPLPATRRQLYDHVVKQLIRGDWSSGAPPERTDDALALLTQWAWEGASAAATVTGIGDWGEDLVARSHPDSELRRSVDNVAPLFIKEDGSAVRRFRHRVLMEHFVAMHIAALPSHDAVEVLLPHLWYDSDWVEVVPAAIAAHHDRDLVLDMLLKRGLARENSRLSPANRELDAHLAALAAESQPSDWTPDHENLIHRARVDLVRLDPWSVAQSAHWLRSGEQVWDAILTELQSGIVDSVLRQMASLNRFQPSDEIRRTAIAAVVENFWDAEPWSLDMFIIALKSFCTSPGDHQLIADHLADHLTEFGTLPPSLQKEYPALLSLCGGGIAAMDLALAILELTAFSDSYDVLQFLSVIEVLKAPAETRVRVAELVATGPSINNLYLAELLEVIDRLDPSGKSRQMAVTHFYASLLNLCPSSIPYSIWLLHELEQPVRRELLTETLIIRLSNADERDIQAIVEAFAAGYNREIAITAIFTVLPTVPPNRLRSLVEVLVRSARPFSGLSHGNDELPANLRTEALDRLLRRLTDATPDQVIELMMIARLLGTPRQIWDRAWELVINGLHDAEPADLGRWAELLDQLDPYGVTRQAAAEAMASHLPALKTEDPSTIIAEWTRLNLTGKARRIAVDAMLMRLDSDEDLVLEGVNIEDGPIRCDLMIALLPEILDLDGPDEDAVLEECVALLETNDTSDETRRVAAELIAVHVAAISGARDASQVPVRQISALERLDRSGAARILSLELIVSDLADRTSPPSSSMWRNGDNFQETLHLLVPGADEARRATLTAIVSRIPDAGYPAGIQYILKVLTDLFGLDAAQMSAANAIADQIPQATRYRLRHLLGVVKELDSRGAAEAVLVRAIATRIRTIDPQFVTEVLGEVAALHLSVEGQDEVVEAVVDRLAVIDHELVVGLVRVSDEFRPSSRARNTLAEAVVSRLGELLDGNVANLKHLLWPLRLKGALLSDALSAIIIGVTKVPPQTLRDVMNVLEELDPSGVARQQAMAVVISRAGEDWYRAMALWAEVLDQLDPSGAAQESVLDAVINRVKGLYEWDFSAWSDALAHLDPSGSARDRARHVIIEELRTVPVWETGDLVSVLALLDPSGESQGHLIESVLTRLTNPEGSDLIQSILLLDRLGVPDNARMQVSSAIERALPSADSDTLLPLLRVLYRLRGLQRVRSMVAETILGSLDTLAGSDEIVLLVRFLRYASTADEWLAEVSR